MLAKFRVLMIAVLAIVAVPETIFADDSAKVTALEALLKQYMDENAELKKAIAEQGANEPEAGADIVVDETVPAEGAGGTERLDLYSSEVICQRALLNDKEYGLVVKMDAQKYADEAERRGLNCVDGSKDVAVQTSYTCEDDPAYCNAQHLCEFATTRTGRITTWATDPAKIDYVSEAKSRKLSCSLTFPLASCNGWNGTVNVIDGVDTTTSIMKGQVLAKDVKEFCTRDPDGITKARGGQLTVDQCVAKYLSKQNDPLKSTANCETGELRLDWFVEGKAKTSTANFPLNVGVDPSCGSGVRPLISQFALLCPKNANSDDWIAAGQQRQADAAKQKADAQAAEQKRLADEKQKKADADAKAAEQKRLADEKQMKADADAKAAEQKRLADEKQKKADAAAKAGEKNVQKSNSDYGTCTKDHELLATVSGKYFSRQDIGRSFWKQCTTHFGLTTLEFTDDYSVAYKSSSMFTGFTYGTTNSIYSGGSVVCMDVDLGIKKRGFGWDCAAS